MILPGAALTPKAGCYVVSILKVPTSRQGELAASFVRYLAIAREENRPEFMMIAASREDNETVINFSGYRTKDAAQAAMGVGTPPAYYIIRNGHKGLMITQPVGKRVRISKLRAEGLRHDHC